MNALDEMVNPRSGASVGDTFIYSVPAEVARAAPAELARLRTIEYAFFNTVAPDGFHQCGIHEECPECDNEGTHAEGCKLAAALTKENT